MSMSSERILHNSMESLTFRRGQAQVRKSNLAQFNRILYISHMEFRQNVQDSKIIVKDSPILVLVLTIDSLHLILHFQNCDFHTQICKMTDYQRKTK